MRNIATPLVIGAVIASAIIIGEEYKVEKPVASYRDKAARTARYNNPARSPFEEEQILLASMRGAGSVCTTATYNCREWTKLALHCELQSNGETTHISKPCTKAEGLRETVTGIELSTAPGAYTF